MNRFACFLVSGLIVTQAACAMRGARTPYLKAETAPEVATTWGASDPKTDLKWTYKDSPTPAFEGAPDYALTEIVFARNSNSLDREAVGALRTASENLNAGGDREDPGEVKLLVLGFADGTSERSLAEELGLRRAEAARTQLVKLGFRKENIQVASFGARYSAAKRWEKVKQEYERNAEVWVLK